MGILGGLFKSGAFRSAAGTAMGAAYGGITSDSQHPNNLLRDIVLGGIGGAAIGVGTTKTFWRGAAGTAKGIGRGGKYIGKKFMEKYGPSMPGAEFMKGYRGQIARDFPTKSAGQGQGMKNALSTKGTPIVSDPLSRSVDQPVWMGRPSGKSASPKSNRPYSDESMSPLVWDYRNVRAGLGASWQSLRKDVGTGTGVVGKGISIADSVIAAPLRAAVNHPLLIGGPLATVGAASLLFGHTAGEQVLSAGPTRDFQNSAEGVTFGLHNSRHGNAR